MGGWREARKRLRRRAPFAYCDRRPEELEPRLALTTGYLTLNLASDQSGAALIRDPNLVDPWGLAVSPSGGNFWVADHGSGVVTNYGGDVSGTPFARGSLVFSVPGGGPTGQTINGGSGFAISSGAASGPASLLLAGDGGKISGWNQAVPLPVPSTTGQTALASSGAIFTGMTLADNGAQTLLYAADFHHGAIDAFDANFSPVALPGGFRAPGLPSDFAPYNIANLGGRLYVTFAKQDANGQSAVAGGGGAVAIFTTDGQFVKTLTASAALNAPWGVAIAPANFGDFSSDVLVGNWGDGRINAFNQTDGSLMGTLASPGGSPIAIDGLHGLSFGNGLTAGDGNVLFYTAGGAGGLHGSFGAITSAQVAGLSAAGASTTAGLNVPFNGVVATFVDADASLAAGSFSAQINWGDGVNSSGTVVSLGGGRFNLTGTHTYSQTGLKSLTATIQDARGNLAFASAVVNVKVPQLTATSVGVAATEDAAFSGVVATFTDADGNVSASAYQAAIDWGDGSNSRGTIVADGAGGFSVTGAHVYADEGGKTIQVTLTDSDGDQVVVSDSATVAEADTLSGQGQNIVATEGQTATGATATFSDVNLAATASDFTATIDWGDGTTGAGVVSGAQGAFTVSGSHVYAKAGAYQVKTSLVDPAPGAAAASVQASAQVADAALAALGFTFATVEAKTFSGAVASFTDANPGAAAADFSATIDWGDGTTTSGSIAAVAGGFQVSGTHAYGAAAAGIALSVQIADAQGAKATGRPLAIVADAPLSVAVLPFGGYEGATLSNVVVAAFSDAGSPLPPADYTATIDWGDGATTAGVVSRSGGGFQVAGSHVYADERNFSLVATVRDPAGAVGVGRGAAAILETLLVDGSRGTANQRWVNELYGDLLGRPADTGALTFWGGMAAQGVNRNAIASAIETSDEFRGREVNTLFQTYLHRAADAGARSYFAAQLAAGATLESVAASLIGSDEYYHNRAGGSADGFLSALYQDALGRPVDAGAKAYFEKLLSAGTTRGAVASIVLDSDEHRARQVQNYFELYLDRAATSGSTTFWLAFLRQGHRDEYVAAAIVGSDEFFLKTAP